MTLIKQLQTSIQELEAATEKYKFALAQQFDATLTRVLLGEVDGARLRLGKVLDTIRTQSIIRELDCQTLPYLTSKASAALIATTQLTLAFGETDST